MASKLVTLAPLARAIPVARLRRRSLASGLTQEEQGRLIGTDAKGVRRLLAHGRKRADRFDLFCALEAAAPNEQGFSAPVGVAVLQPEQAAPARACTENTVTCHGAFSGRGVTLRGGAMWDVARKAAA